MALRAIAVGHGYILLRKMLQSSVGRMMLRIILPLEDCGKATIFLKYFIASGVKYLYFINFY
ncbi:MAG: hypothetical protein EOO35_00205 [Cyanobacteriota bacterium]|nr:MAG: hypothetical protein EOO35_00205 [Cyanobacteriota bacterium]